MTSCFSVMFNMIQTYINFLIIIHFVNICHIDPGIPYYITVSAGTTGGNGSETEIIVFSKEKGS